MQSTRFIIILLITMDSKQKELLLNLLAFFLVIFSNMYYCRAHKMKNIVQLGLGLS